AMPDAVVVGSGPNGLAAAIALSQAGRQVLVLEAAPSVGGGLRTAELTEPGFRHDVCSAIHPLGIGSPYLRTLPLAEHGLEWIQPPAPLAHPFDDGSAARLERSVEATAETLGVDAGAYRRLMEPIVAVADPLLGQLLGPHRLPRSPLSAARLARRRFRGDRARGLVAGLAAHSNLPLSRFPTGAIGLALALCGHVVG